MFTKRRCDPLASITQFSGHHGVSAIPRLKTLCYRVDPSGTTPAAKHQLLVATLGANTHIHITGVFPLTQFPDISARKTIPLLSPLRICTLHLSAFASTLSIPSSAVHLRFFSWLLPSSPSLPPFHISTPVRDLSIQSHLLRQSPGRRRRGEDARSGLLLPWLAAEAG